MAGVSRVESLDYDFEDLLDSFERKFAKKLLERPHPTENAEHLPRALHPPTPVPNLAYEISDFENELTELLNELQQGVLISRQGDVEEDDVSRSSGRTFVDDNVLREVLRAEIRGIMGKVRQFEEITSDSSSPSSSHKASIASLKRRAREATSEAEGLRKQKKQLELRERHLQEKQETYLGKIKMLQDQVGLLRTERGEQENKLRDLEDSVSALAADKKRLEKNVALLRNELLSTHHKVSEQKLKTSQAERRVADLEARASELRVSEGALSDRVKELHEVQAQMLDEMKKVVDSKDVPSARRALSALSQQRSRIVGKIAAIMTKRNNGLNPQADENGDVTASELNSPSHTDVEGETGPSGHSSGLVGDSGSPGFGSRTSSGEDNTLQRRTSILARLRFGSSAANKTSPSAQGAQADRNNSQLSRAAKTQIYETNLERSREAAERDSGVLCEVIENKAAEIERLEKELRAAKSEANALERELHTERQNKRGENRNLHVPADEEAKKNKMDAIQRRTKPQSLFDWQSASRMPSDGDSSNMPHTRAA